MSSEIDVDQKAVDLTQFFFKTPSYRKSTALLLIASFIFGVIGRLNLTKPESLLETFLYGGTDGILILALPAIVAALLATFFVSRKQFKNGFKYFSLIALFSAVLYGLVLLFGLLVGQKLFAGLEESSFVIIGNALVLVLWFASTWIALAYRKKALFLCTLQPLTSLAFIVLWNKFSIFESSVAFSHSPLVAVFKLAVASIILLIAVGALGFIINAPTKRNFGISTIDTITMFFAQWVSGSKDLEHVLAENGEFITTEVGVIQFKQGSKTKGVFVVPQLHYGPIGNLGGSEFPGLISSYLNKQVNAPVFVFKGAANHDFNPVYSSDISIVNAACIDAMHEGNKRAVSAISFLSGRSGYSQIFGLDVDGTAFLTLSRQPQNCEDIDQALGRALHNKILSMGFNEAILVDRHHCKRDGVLFGAGSKEYLDYENAIENIERYGGKLWFGAATSRREFTVEQGIGKGGLKVSVMQVGKKKSCFIVVDANNCLPEFRNAVVNYIGDKYSFDFVDLMTTDSHAVNSINGIHNPLGARVNRQEFISTVDKTVSEAIMEMAPCTASAYVKRFDIEVLGPQRSSELVITVNSIFAVLKILAPVVFLSSIVLAFLALVAVK